MIDPDWNKLNFAPLWREWIVKSEAQWSETVSKMMKDDRTGGLLKKQVDEARMMHRMFAEMAQASLAVANLPSRSDFEALDERMGRIEDGLAGVSAALVQLRSALVATGAATPTQPRPPRNRKPAARAARPPAARE